MGVFFSNKPENLTFIPFADFYCRSDLCRDGPLPPGSPGWPHPGRTQATCHSDRTEDQAVWRRVGGGGPSRWRGRPMGRRGSCPPRPAAQVQPLLLSHHSPASHQNSLGLRFLIGERQLWDCPRPEFSPVLNNVTEAHPADGGAQGWVSQAAARVNVRGRGLSWVGSGPRKTQKAAAVTHQPGRPRLEPRAPSTCPGQRACRGLSGQKHRSSGSTAEQTDVEREKHIHTFPESFHWVFLFVCFVLL